MHDLPERSGTAQTEEVPEYTETGLNQTLRIDGWSVIYEPEFGVWFDEYRHAYTADEIHQMILEGRHRVLPWTPEVTA
jgi:hypothetical protein